MWYTVGILHDIDRDYVSKDMDKHLGEAFEKIVSEINLPSDMIDDIRSHYPEKYDIPASTLMRKYLLSVDELSGFLHAYSLMRPEGFVGMDAR